MAGTTPHTQPRSKPRWIGLKAYREAKTAFETALRKEPADAVSRDLLARVSGLLGEGDNSSVKNQIVAVAAPAEFLADVAPPADIGDTESAYYAYQVKAVSFVRGKEFRQTEYRRLRVFDRHGVDSYSTLDFEFDPLFEEIYLNRLEVRDGDGKLVLTGSVADSFVADVRDGESASQKKVLRVPVPGLKPGYTIESVVSRRDIGDAREMQLLRMLMSSSVPIGRTALVLYAGKSDVRHWASPGISQQEVAGGIAWVVDRPTVLRIEPDLPPIEEFLPNVVLSDASISWDTAVRQYLDSIASMTAPDSAATELARSITAGCRDDRAKAAAILAKLQTEFTYKAIEFGRRSRIPAKASEVIAHRYGDCKDHAILLSQLLRAAGIDAKLGLVRSYGPTHPELPAMDQFNHMIVYAPSLGAGFFDCTDKDSDLSPGWATWLSGQDVLLLDAKPQFVKVPPPQEGQNAAHAQRAMRITEDGNVSVAETLTATGACATRFRAYFHGTEPHDRVRMIQAILAPLAGDVSVQEVRMENLEQADRPVDIKMSYMLWHRFHRIGTELVGSSPAVWERYLMMPERIEKREMPVRLYLPVSFTSNVTMEAPQAYSISTSPGPVKVDDAFTTATSSTAQLHDGRLALRQATVTHRGDFAAGQYSAILQSRDAAITGLEPALVLKKAR